MNDQQKQDLIGVALRFPALRGMPQWRKAEKLVLAGDAVAAISFCKDALASNPKLLARNKTAIDQQRRRRAFLVFQKDTEKQLDTLLRGMSDKIGGWLVSAADDSGKIPLWKMKPLLDRIKKINTATFTDIRTLIAGAVRQSVKYGITDNMTSAQIAIDHHIAMRTKESVIPVAMMAEREIIEADKKATLATTSVAFRTIYDNVKKKRITQGLFTDRTRGGHQTGFALSTTVWDMRDGQFKRMRNVVGSGIAQGRSATSMATEIKRWTIMGGAPRGIMEEPGRGVYRTAYKNALRVTRTETNNAYHEADIEYAIHKGYRKVWNRNVGDVDDCAQCDALDGKEFAPDEVPALPHPNCLLPGQMVLLVDGSEKKIEDVRCGDIAVGCSGEGRLVTRIHKNTHHGPCVRVCFSNGRNLVLTGNHPIYVVRKRWVNAEDLCEGDEVLSYEPPTVCSDTENSPSALFKILRFLGVLHFFPSRLMPSAAVYLYGQACGRDRDVDIVRPEREQWDGGNKKPIQEGQHRHFTSTQLAGTLNALGSSLKLFFGPFCASNSIMRRLRHVASLIFSPQGPAQFSGFGKSSPMKTVLKKAHCKTAPRDSQSGGYVLDALSGNMLLVGDVDIKIPHNRHKILYHIARVKSITNIQHDGWVYNLTVDMDESYVAQSILCHNCSCYLTTIIPGVS